MNLEQVVKEVVLRGRVEGAAEVALGYQKIDTAAQSTERAINKLRMQFDDQSRQLEELQQRTAAYERSMQAVAAANDNVARSTKVANDNSKGIVGSFKESADGAASTTKSFFGMALETLKIAGYLKLASSVAYAASPAIRGLVDGATARTLATTGPAIAAIGTSIPGVTAAASRAGPILSTFYKIFAGAELLLLGNQFKVATAGALALSPALREVAKHEVVDGLKAVPTAIGMIAPAAATVGSTILSRLMPVLSFVSKIAVPVLLVAAAWEALKFAVTLASERIEKAVELQKKSNETGFGVDFIQRIEEGAKKTKGAVESLIATMKKFNEVSKGGLEFGIQTDKDKLGVTDSEISKRLKELTDLGNFKDNQYVKEYQQAITTEEKYRAIIKLIAQAGEQGQRLAALNLASTFASPEVMTNLKASTDYLVVMQEKADKVSETKLLRPEDVALALSLKKRLEDAEAVLKEKWLPTQNVLVDLGMKFKEAWVWIVERTAAGLGFLNSMVDRMGALVSKAREYTAIPFRFGAGLVQEFVGVPSVSDAPPKSAVPDPQMAAARTSLSSLLLQRKAIDAAMQDSSNTYNKVLGDQSRLVKASEETSKAWDREVKSIEKHTASLQADALAVGMSQGEHASLRAEMQLLRAAEEDKLGVTKENIAKYIDLRATMSSQQAMEQSGIKLSDERKEKFNELTEAAKKYQQALEVAKVADKISFDRKTVFLDPLEVQIAHDLKGIYGNDIPKALASSEAAGLRFNDVLKNINSEAGTTLSGWLKDMSHQVAPMEALANAGKRLADSLIDIAGKRLASAGLNSLFGAGTEAAGLTTGATSAASILTTAGATVSASLVAGATEAAAILGVTVPTAAATLPVAGATTGAEVLAAGAGAGTAIAAGGAAAGTAIWGPLALVAAAIAAAVAIGESFLGKAKAERQALQEALKAKVAADVADVHRLSDLQNRMTLARGEDQTLIGQLKIFDNKATEERVDAIMQGGNRIAELTAVQEAERAKIIADWNAKVIADAKKAQDDFDRAFNDASGKGFLNQFADLFKQIEDFKKAGIDPGKVDQLFDLSAQKIIDDTGLVGDAFTELTKLFPSLVGHVHEATKALADEAAAQAKLNDVAKTIVDYLSNLQVGPGSGLSPSQRYAAAATTYSATLALAQGGNLDAQARITKDFENFRLASQARYGSSANYQRDLNAGINALLALPAVVNTTDPVVQAVRDSIKAIQLTTAAIGDGNTLIGDGNTILANQKAALDLIKAQTQATSDNTASQKALQETQNILIAQTKALVEHSNDFLNSINNLQATASSTLALLNSQFTSKVQIDYGQPGGAVPLPTVVSNNMLTALNKIVFNTKLIADATGNLRFVPTPNSVVNFGTWGTYEQGGIAPPYSSFIFGEHHPQGPFFGRAGAQPIPITPYMPDNDNGGIVAELRELRKQGERMERTIGTLLARIADLEQGNIAAIDRNTAHRGEEGERTRRNDRLAARKGKTA